MFSIRLEKNKKSIDFKQDCFASSFLGLRLCTQCISVRMGVLLAVLLFSKTENPWGWGGGGGGRRCCEDGPNVLFPQGWCHQVSHEGTAKSKGNTVVMPDADISPALRNAIVTARRFSRRLTFSFSVSVFKTASDQFVGNSF